MRQHQKAFDTAEWYDYPIAAVVSAIAGGLGSLTLGFGFFVIFIAPAVGAGAAEIVRYAVRKRRARYLGWVAAGGFILGATPAMLLPVIGLVFSLLGGQGVGLGGMLGLVWVGVYLVLGVGALLGRLQGIVIGR